MYLVYSLLWLKGPTFLTSGDYPEQLGYRDSSSRIVIESEYTYNVSMVTVKDHIFSVLPVERWSSLDKAIRARGWILRFLQPHTERKSGELHYCVLVRFQHVLMKHAGVGFICVSLRNQRSTVGLRRLAKQIVSRCVHCKRHDSARCE